MFDLEDVQAGAYVLHVWQENLPEIRQPLVVGSEPLELDVR